MRSYLLGNTADRLADALLYLALGWAAAHTGGALSASAVLAAGSVPRLVLLLLGGAIGDRHGLLRTAYVTLLGRVALMVAFVFALAVPHPSPWLLAGCAAGFGLIDAAHLPAMTGLSALLVRGKMLTAAQGLAGGATEAAEVIAAPVAGFLLAWIPLSVAAAAAVLVIVTLGCLISVRTVGAIGLSPSVPVALDASGSGPVDRMDPVETSESQGVLGEVRDGVQAAMRLPDVRGPLVVFLVANLAGTAPLLAGIPLRVTSEGWGASAFGAISTCLALGGVIGLLTLARVGHRLTRPPLQIAGLLILPGSLGVAGLSVAPSVWGVCASAALVGLCFSPGAGMVVAGIKNATPDALLGRTMALVQFAVYVGIPLGYLIYGTIARVSLTVAGLTMAAALLACGGAVITLSRASRDDEGAP